MAVDTANITGGPAQLQIGGSQVSHTQGGVSMKMSAKHRMRTVDQFGESPVAVIHQGDEVSITAALAEWTKEVLAEVYDPGDDKTAEATDPYMGIGRSAGYIYGKKAILIIPFATAQAANKIEIFQGSPVGELELAYNNDDDRVFDVEFVACIDETQDDGGFIARIYL